MNYLVFHSSWRLLMDRLSNSQWPSFKHIFHHIPHLMSAYILFIFESAQNLSVLARHSKMNFGYSGRNCGIKWSASLDFNQVLAWFTMQTKSSTGNINIRPSRFMTFHLFWLCEYFSKMKIVTCSNKKVHRRSLKEK